jgi:WS/DGAT/MGAT family acyltransferase
MRQLTSLDAQFLAFEDGRSHGHVSALGIYDPSTAPGGSLTLDALREVLAARLHLLPPFRWRLATVPFGLDHPYWIDDPDFDLEFHLRELALPAPGDDAQLAEQVSRLHSRPLDRARPLWELYLIHGLRDGRVAVMTKVHHAAIDGVSGGEVLGVLLDPSPEGRDVPAPEATSPPRAAPGDLEMLGRAALGMPRLPLRAARALPRALPHLDQIATVRSIPGARRIAALSARVISPRADGGVVERPPLRAPRTRLNGRISAHRRFAFTSLSLTEVKALKDELGVTVNDVVMAICAGAVRRRLASQDELPDAPLLAMVPMSVRAPEEAGTFGNRVTTMIVPLPTDEPDARRRVERVHEAMRSAKERHGAIPATLLQDANHFIPPALLARASRAVGSLATRDALAPPMNLVISNVPGSPAPLFLAGARLEAQYPVSVIIDGVGLNVTVLSYRDRLDFGVIGDRELAPDVAELAADLSSELAELRRLLPTRGRASATTKETAP